MLGQRFEPVVPGGSSAFFKLYSAKRQIHLIMQHKHILRLNPVKSQKRSHGLPAFIHIGKRLAHQPVRAINLSPPKCQRGLWPFNFIHLNTNARQIRNESIQHHPAQIMPSFFIFFARVAKGNNQPSKCHVSLPSKKT